MDGRRKRRGKTKGKGVGQKGKKIVGDGVAGTWGGCPKRDECKKKREKCSKIQGTAGIGRDRE